MSNKPGEKMFVVRKYIMATSAASAIRKDKKTPVHDCWISDEWSNGNQQQLADAIGFHDTDYDVIEED